MPDEIGNQSKHGRDRKKRPAEKRRLYLERARERVEERRAAGEDVAAYALENHRAVRFLTEEERQLYEEKKEARSRRRLIKEKRIQFAEQHSFYAYKDAWKEGKNDDECNQAAGNAYKATMRFTDDVIEDMIEQERSNQERPVQRTRLKLVAVDSPGPGPTR